MNVWGITHRGMVREQNQDAFACRTLPDGRIIALVCDGMGGARAGNVASSMAVELFMRKLEEQGQPGDVIVLAGKGHETYQEVNHVKHHMDEREIVAEYFA